MHNQTNLQYVSRIVLRRRELGEGNEAFGVVDVEFFGADGERGLRIVAFEDDASGTIEITDEAEG